MSSMSSHLFCDVIDTDDSGWEDHIFFVEGVMLWEAFTIFEDNVIRSVVIISRNDRNVVVVFVVGFDFVVDEKDENDEVIIILLLQQKSEPKKVLFLLLLLLIMDCWFYYIYSN